MNEKLVSAMLWFLLASSILAITGTLMSGSLLTINNHVQFTGMRPLILIIISGSRIYSGFELMTTFCVCWFSFLALRLRNWARKGLLIVFSMEIIWVLGFSFWIIKYSEFKMHDYRGSIYIFYGFSNIIFRLFYIFIFTRKSIKQRFK